MGKHEKLIEKLLKLPNNFTFEEMVSLLQGFGYTADQRGRSSGSAVMFYNKKTKDKIMFHKPHPEKEVKKYVLKLILNKLRANKLI
jgi:hypothetical protein